MPKIPMFLQRALQAAGMVIGDLILRVFHPLTLLLAGMCWMEFDRYMEWRITHERTYACEFQPEHWSFLDGWKGPLVDCGEIKHMLAVTETTTTTSGKENANPLFAEVETLLFRLPSAAAPLPPPDAK